MFPPRPGPPPAARPAAEPAKTRLGRLLAERPEARSRIARAVGGLLAVALATVAAIGVLLIWHLRRRAGLIREKLATRCDVSLADWELLDPDARTDDDGDGAESSTPDSR